MKDQLIFDVTSAQTIADSDSVGAYVRSSDGTLITHTTNGAKEGLDVNIINDNIEVTQGTSPWVIGDGGSSITVDASDLDIRDLTAVSDSIQSWLHDGAGTALTSTLVGSDQALDVNVVGGLNVEVDLSHVDDSVRLGDGTNYLTSTTIGSDIGLDVNVINDPSTANSAILSAVDTLTAAGTAEKVVATNLANRKCLFVYNKSNRKIYIGGSAVTASNGFPVSPGSYLEMRAGASVDVYYNGEANGQEIRTLELS